MMKIITYKVNGLLAAVSKGLPEWLEQENPDILCLQETKLQPDQYPGEVFEALGYKSYLYSAQKKGYSGVALLTKQEPDHVEYGMGMEAYDNEGRFIRAALEICPWSVFIILRGQAGMSVRLLKWCGWKTFRSMCWSCRSLVRT